MNCSQNAQDSSWQSEYDECDPESPLVTIRIFSQNLIQYIITHWPLNFKKNLLSGSFYKKLSTEVFKKIS